MTKNYDQLKKIAGKCFFARKVLFFACKHFFGRHINKLLAGSEDTFKIGNGSSKLYIEIL
jgi:hypothetical protein